MAARPSAGYPVHVIGPDHGHLPGNSEWLFVKLYGHPDRHTAILSQIPALLFAWDGPVQWWFLPYRDPKNHLRLRFRAPATPNVNGQPRSPCSAA